MGREWARELAERFCTLDRQTDLRDGGESFHPHWFSSLEIGNIRKRPVTFGGVSLEIPNSLWRSSNTFTKWSVGLWFTTQSWLSLRSSDLLRTKLLFLYGWLITIMTAKRGHSNAISQKKHRNNYSSFTETGNKPHEEKSFKVTNDQRCHHPLLKHALFHYFLYGWWWH